MTTVAVNRGAIGAPGVKSCSKMEASAGFEPAVEVLQIAICSSPEFAEVHCVLYGKPECSLEFILVRQSSPALPSPLSSKRSWEAITRPCERSLLTT